MTDRHTHRLELIDATVREWDARVLSADRDQGIVLDRSAFYPGGGGQPPDAGVLLWGGVQTRIVGARLRTDDVQLIPHEDDPLPDVGGAVRGALDDTRRTLLMRTHSAMHVLSAIVYRDFAAKVTGSAMDPGTEVRIVDLVGLDTQADGGTHVASTRQIGALRVIKTENKGKGFPRVRFHLA